LIPAMRAAMALVVLAACSRDVSNRTETATPQPTAPAPEASRPAPPVTDTGTDVRVTIRTRTEWIRVGDGSAVAVRRAIDPATREPYDASAPDVRGLRREFRLERTELRVGEPILAALHIALDREGAWSEPIGGNYRGRGRDDNFLFLMRHEDGTWVADPYPGEPMIGGGISSRYEVTREEPRSYWLAVSRWATVTRPGRYDVYALQFDHDYETIGWREALRDAIPPELARTLTLGDDGNTLVDKTTGAATELRLAPAMEPEADTPPSPLADRVPEAVRGRLDEHQLAAIVDYAHFVVDVAKPTRAERAAMIAEWNRIASDEPTESWPTPKLDAAREAMFFAPTGDFLPQVRAWLRDNDRTPTQYLHGLAFNPDPDALPVLLEAGKRSLGGLYYLRPEHRIRAVPTLIDWLASDDDELRSQAYDRLAHWAGDRFGATWDGYRLGRPTVEEAKAIAPLARAWWKRSSP